MALLDDLLRLFGTNRTRLAWKWRNLRQGVERRRRALQNRGAALTYAHQSCPRCSHPASADDKVCSRCGARLLGVGLYRARRALGWLLPGDLPVMSIGLLAACAALFLISTRLGLELGERYDSPQLGTTLALLELGSASSAHIADGQWWRLCTAMFLHVDLLHVVMNGAGLWLAGSVVEDLFGRSRTLVAFVATGLVGNLVTFAWRMQHGPGSSAGASGAILGLIGVVIGHALRYRNGRGRALRQRFVPYAIYAVLMGFGLGADNGAHLGGLVAGIALGLVLGDRQAARRLPDWLWRALALAAFALVVACAYLAHRAPDPLAPGLFG